MAHSVHATLQPHETRSMTDEDMQASLERIERLIQKSTSGFKFTPFAIREVLANVSTITRLNLQLSPSAPVAGSAAGFDRPLPDQPHPRLACGKPGYKTMLRPLRGVPVARFRAAKPGPWSDQSAIYNKRDSRTAV